MRLMSIFGGVTLPTPRMFRLLEFNSSIGIFASPYSRLNSTLLRKHRSPYRQTSILSTGFPVAHIAAQPPILHISEVRFAECAFHPPFPDGYSPLCYLRKSRRSYLGPNALYCWHYMHSIAPIDTHIRTFLGNRLFFLFGTSWKERHQDEGRRQSLRD